MTSSGTGSELAFDYSNNHLEFLDNVKATFGTGGDMQIFHDGTNSRIENDVTNLFLQSQLINLTNAAGSEVMINANANGAVNLYYDGAKKIETDTNGVTVTGNVDAGSGQFRLNDSGRIRLGTAQDFEIYHDGNNSFITDAGTGNLYIRGDNTLFIQSASGEDKLKATTNGSVEIYYDDVKKFETTAYGTNTIGTAVNDGMIVSGITTTTSHIYLSQDGNSIRFGNVQDLRIYHYAAESTNRFDSYGITNEFINKDTNGAVSERMVRMIPNGAVELYHNGSMKLDTRSSGVGIGGDLFFVDSSRIYMGSSNDFIFFHDGSNSNIVNATGSIVYRSDTHHFKDKDNGDTHAKFIHDGAVELYHDNSKKFETTSGGAKVTGDLVVTGDLSSEDVTTISSVGIITAQNGINVTGGNINLGDSANTSNHRIFMGADNDMFMYHNGTHGVFTNTTGNLHIIDDSIKLQNSNSTTRLEVHTSGVTVTGNISVSGTVDGRDVATDGTKLDGIEASAPADQTPSAILPLIKTVDGAGSGLDADTLDGISSASFVRSDAADTASGDITFSGGAGAVTLSAGSDIRMSSGSWTGEHAGKIQFHDNRLYFQGGSNGFQFRDTSGASVVDLTASGSISGKNLTFAQDVTFNGGAGAVNIPAASDIRFTSGNWTGNSGSTPKIQAHSNYLYIVGGSNGIIFREDGTDRVHIDGSGNMLPATDSAYSLGTTGNRWTNTFTDALTVTNNVSVGGDVTVSGGSGALTVNANSDIRFSAGTWTGDAGYKIQAHSGGLYIQAPIVRFRSNNGSDRWYIQTNGEFEPSVDNTYDIGGSSKRVRNIRAVNFYGSAANLTNLPTSEFGVSATGNFGQYEAHGTYTDANTEPSYWGWNFSTGSTNFPNSTSTQWYRCRVSLGTSYGKGTATGDYSMELCYPRNSRESSGQMWTRTIENGSEGSWLEVGSRPYNSIIPRANNTIDLGSSSTRWRNLYVNDLQLSNEAKKDTGGNDVDGTWGNYTIQEGENDLFLINRRSGKKYKFNLTEVS